MHATTVKAQAPARPTYHVGILRGQVQEDRDERVHVPGEDLARTGHERHQRLCAQSVGNKEVYTRK